MGFLIKAGLIFLGTVGAFLGVVTLIEALTLLDGGGGLVGISLAVWLLLASAACFLCAF